jgi:hypothetical protein
VAEEAYDILAISRKQGGSTPAGAVVGESDLSLQKSKRALGTRHPLATTADKII